MKNSASSTEEDENQSNWYLQDSHRDFDVTTDIFSIIIYQRWRQPVDVCFLLSLKVLPHAGLAKKLFLNNFGGMNFYCFRYDWFFCSMNVCFGPFEIRQFKTNFSGLKIDWGSPQGCSYLRNAYYVITFYCFTHFFVGVYKQFTMASFQARNRLRPDNLSGDVTDDCLNNFIYILIVWIILYLSLKKSPNPAVGTSL